ncbi:neutral zinc metallopeptidase [Sphaerisporangium rhizosphaerae]|uniref:Neutral zinc metallopeptidase n=1 Tax=Sphaerisporangium rhizosphaerae TaxID=2269375 RepID=A0ABW2NX73_9ACTN
MISRKRSTTLSAGLLTGLCLAASAPGIPATAASYPVKRAALTRSPLYTSGRLPAARCPEKPVTPGSVASAKRYVLPLLDCLGASWKTQLAKARIRFSEPGVQFITRPGRVCGHSWPKNAQGLYCPSQRRIVIMLDKHLTRQAEDLFLMDVIAHEYGHHVQNLSGIEAAFNGLAYRGKPEYYEQYRRLELQAECFAGAFIGSVWDSLDRTSDDWDYLLEATRESGDERTKVRDHGKGRTIANWLSRGFKAAGPGACNTWGAGAAMVASAPA